jgi:Mce-associated membrane protein
VNPTLYDILGVSSDASREEIRKAWRDAADRFEPGEGGSTKQFRLFNEAAEVLLDPERRKAYDAELGEESAPDTARNSAATVPGPPMPGTSAVAAPAAPAARPATPAAVHAAAEGGEVEEVEADAREKATAGRLLPWWVLAVLGALTAVAVGAAAYFVTQAQRAEAYQEALVRGSAAAENAAGPVLSYSHETLEADRDAAAKFLTDEYREKYVDTYELVLEGAPQAKATVEAKVLASAPMLTGEKRDPDRVSVLVFVDQATVSAADSEPKRFLNRAQFDMVNVDGTWLVDGITSY